MIYSTDSNFLQPVLQYNSRRGLWRLIEPYTFEWGPSGFRKQLYMDAGFEYDKASVPKFLHGVFRADGPWEAAALFHDRFYRDKGRFLNIDEFTFETFIDNMWKPDSSSWKRKDADELLEYMGVLGGAKKWEARLYKEAVHWYPPNWFKGF